jgi:hypothetical protein
LDSGNTEPQPPRGDASEPVVDALLQASPSLLMQVYSVLQAMPVDSKGRVLQATTTELEQFHMTFDSGADTHLLSLSAAHALFDMKMVSCLKVIGVSGKVQPADMMGKLIIPVQDPVSSERFTIDLGVAHAMDSCPMNLLSVSLLIKAGATVHFEKGNSYFQAYPGARPIAFVEKDGMFQLVAEKGSSADAAAAMLSFATNGHAFGVAADLTLWHQRVRHMSMEDLLKIYKHNLVEGFTLRGRVTPTSCDCDACRQAKIKRAPEHDTRAHPSVASRVGMIFSTDTKEVPYVSLHGYRYVVVFVDNYSRLSFAYFLRSKRESITVLKQFLADMDRLGITVGTITSDRGSEFFQQDGETLPDRDRRTHEFRQFCDANRIDHVVRPVGNKEKYAEVWFRDHFRAVDVMLWAARLTPCLWPEALAYSCFVFNRTPLESNGGASPLQLVVPGKPRWDHFKVWGCTAYEHIPNDEFAKVPGVPRGRKLIFAGFDNKAMGYKLFDPETRRFHSAINVYFYEDFSERIDSLRHHDRRRNLLKKDLPQPIVLGDFEDENSSAVRRLYLDPDAPPPPELLLSSATAAPEGGTSTADSTAAGRPSQGASAASPPSFAPSDQRSCLQDDRWPESPPLCSRSRRAERVRQDAQLMSCCVPCV